MYHPEPLPRRRSTGTPTRAGHLLLLTGCLLAPATLAESVLEELIVTSSRVPTSLRETATSVSVLLADEIQQRGFISLPELLRTQTSVAASNNGGPGKATSVRIRGEEGFRTMVLLDGIDIADTSSPQVSPRLEQLLSSGIDRVEILRGPQGLGYGADAGGVIDIRTRRAGEGFSARVGAEAGRYGTRQLSGSIGAGGERGELVVSVADFSSDSFNARTTDSALRDDDGYDNSTVHARGEWRVTDALSLEAVLRSVDGENAFDGCFNAAFLPTDDCSDDFRQDSWRAGADLRTGSLTHALAYSENRSERDFFAEGASFFAAQGRLERLSYVGSWRRSDALTLVYGADLESEAIDDGSIDRSRDQSGVFAEYRGNITDRLTLTAGLRHDDNDDFGDFTSYRLSASHVMPLAVGELKLKGTYGTGFRAPSLYEISYNRGPFAFAPAADTALVEERSEGYDLGVVWAGADGDFLELVWFDQNVDDLITFDVLGFSGYLQEPGPSDSRGLELSGRADLPGGFLLHGNYVWNDTETPAGEQRPFRPQQLANLSLSYRTADERLRLGINLRASANAVDTTGEALDDYRLLDVNASFLVSAGLQLYLRVENALDENYREIPTYNTAGQAAYAGVRYEF